MMQLQLSMVLCAQILLQLQELAVISLFVLVNDAAVAVVEVAAGALIDVVAVVNNSAVANFAAAAAFSLVVLVNDAAVAVFTAAAVL